MELITTPISSFITNRSIYNNNGKTIFDNININNYEDYQIIIFLGVTTIWNICDDLRKV